jgi:hypothetical protein
MPDLRAAIAHLPGNPAQAGPNSMWINRGDAALNFALGAISRRAFLDSALAVSELRSGRNYKPWRIGNFALVFKTKGFG